MGISLKTLAAKSEFLARLSVLPDLGVELDLISLLESLDISRINFVLNTIYRAARV